MECVWHWVTLEKNDEGECGDEGPDTGKGEEEGRTDAPNSVVDRMLLMSTYIDMHVYFLKTEKENLPPMGFDLLNTFYASAQKIFFLAIFLCLLILEKEREKEGQKGREGENP